MKTYQCYRNYPADSADVTIYVLDNSHFYPYIVVEFFSENPLDEPFLRKFYTNVKEASDFAEEYIKNQNFTKVRAF